MESNDDRLGTLINKHDWDMLLTILKPKFFPRSETGEFFKSLHIVGKQSDNFFIPVQRLDELTPAGYNENDNKK